MCRSVHAVAMLGLVVALSLTMGRAAWSAQPPTPTPTTKPAKTPRSHSGTLLLPERGSPTATRTPKVTPTPTGPTAEELAAEAAKKKEAQILQQAQQLYTKAGREAGSGQLAAARADFERLRKMDLPGDAARYIAMADQALKSIMAKGDELLAKAQETANGKRYLDAAELYGQITQQFRGTVVGRVAAGELDRLEASPETGPLILFARAQRAEQAGDLWKAYQLYLQIAARYPDTEQGRQSETRAADLKTKRGQGGTLGAESADEARKMLIIGDIRSMNDNPSLEPPQYFFQKVIDEFPGTKYAAEAERRLAELQAAEKPKEK